MAGLLRLSPVILCDGGIWTTASAVKLERFASLAETFHLPVVHFVDIPLLHRKQAEKEGTIRAGLAHSQRFISPPCMVHDHRTQSVWRCRRREHESHTLSLSLCVAIADWGSLPIEGGLEAAYKSDLAAAIIRTTVRRD